MKATLLILILIFTGSNLFAQNIVGTWKGNIDLNGNQLPIVFHFTKDSSGNITGTWDSPKQKAIGLPFDAINVNGDTLQLDIKMISGSYEGKFIGNDSIAGMWHQGGGQIALNFSRSTQNNEIEKEETILLPNEKEVSINSASGSKLYGTLLSKNNQQKIAIVVAGSGPTDRDGNSSLGEETNEYKLLAHSLDSENIASFRYDKRGVAKSLSANFRESDLVFDDYVKDAENIFDYLHDTLGFKNIYFIGHSEGSLVAMLASQKKKVSGYISVAGAGRPIDEIIEEQMKPSLSDSLQKKLVLIFNGLKEGKQIDQKEIPKSLPLFPETLQPYFISWLKYSPQKEIKKVNCPILIIQGGCDIQVKIKDANNLHIGNKKSALEIIPTMSHTLKNAGKDCVDQNKTYSDGSMPIDKILVDDVVKFIEKN